MKRSRAGLLLGAWSATLVVVLLFLHGVDPGSTAHSSDGSAYVVVVVRYVALAIGWYLAATTAISLGAHILRVGAAAAVAQRVTAAPIHRLTRAAFGAAFVASTVVPAAAAAQTSQPPPVMVWVEEEQATLAPSPAPAPPTEVREIVVAPGDSLWSLASERLAERLSRDPSDREVSMYWLEVIRINRGHLRDAGVPDLIYPGDRVVLPPP